MFAIGYVLRIAKNRREASPEESVPGGLATSQLRLLVLLSALYYLAYGLIYLQEYGVNNVGGIMASLHDPGSAYFAKFDVYARQRALGETNTAARVITIVAVLSAPLVPITILHWRRLTGDVRLLAFIGVAAYASFFLAIGTLSGLAALLIYAGVSVLVLQARSNRVFGRRRRGLVVAVLLGAFVFVAYMSYNQGARVEAVGTWKKYQPNPVIERIAGQQLARGLTVTAFYPTHGYQGLAYNLETPRGPWTQFRGSSRAIDSYLAQYGFGRTVAEDTYPARTEARTGWPADRYWATIYPWLASDLTFWGAAFFMFGAGWWLARFWIEAVVQGRLLSVLMLCQLGVLIVFIPANNQLGISRPSSICVATLAALYGADALNRRFQTRRHRPVRLSGGRSGPGERPASNLVPARRRPGS
jgi:hypothetical protein